MGNIERLIRNGHTNEAATNFGVMDNLTYAYDAGNKLQSVQDSGNGTYGFKDGANTTTEYLYDDNGNMTTDANKGIMNITYNHLNLPIQITLADGTISYIYDAAGVKLKKIVNNTAESSLTSTEYAGNYIYENGNLQFFNTAEGYVTPKPSGGYDYIYRYKDHLDNTRVSYVNIGSTSSPVLEIIEESNYYPFGLQHKGYNNVVSANSNSTAEKFKYNGKEFSEDLGLNLYEYGARMFDPATAFFTSVDPRAESFEFQTPYAYAANNPIYFEEKNGEFPFPPGWKKAARVLLNHLASKTDNKVAQFAVGWVEAGVESLPDSQTDTEDYVNKKLTGVKQLMDGDYKSAAVELNIGGAGDQAAIAKEVKAVKSGDARAIGRVSRQGAETVASIVAPIKLAPKVKLKPKTQLPNPMKGKKLGHTFSKHGSQNTKQLTKQAEGSGSPQGQWIDNGAAEKIISDNLNNLSNGAITVPIPKGVGRVINPDGSYTPATHARLVPSSSGVKTAYPGTIETLPK